MHHSLIDKMVNHAESVKEECCGFLLGQNGAHPSIVEVVPARNVAASNKEKQFEIDPLEYLGIERYAERNHIEVIGVYHSHPDHPAVPSEHDLQAAQPNFSYVILSLKNARFHDMKSWRLTAERTFIEEKIISNHN